MSDYAIRIEGGFTTSVFYNYVLKELHKCLSGNRESRVVFDFTKTKYVDALVIPNLLCVGYILKEHNGKTPIVATIDESLYVSNSSVLKYLREIGFVHYCEKYGLFEIHGFEKNTMSLIPEYCATFCFDNEDISKDSIAREITKKSYNLFKNHLTNHFDEDDIFGYGNKFAKFGAELCKNSSIHGDSFSFMTIQSYIRRQTVSIAVSDCGHGFYNSLSNRIANSIESHQLLTIDDSSFLDEKSENLTLHSIIECAFYRYFDSVYGLWDIAKTVLSDGGLIRIHSSDSRIIFTPETFRFISVFDKREDLRDYLIKKFLKSKNYRYHQNLKYRGVHIEIEMPMKSNKRRVGYDYI